ncbi:Gfo/Idh/MocA family protein [Devosia ginsengisoli]|nr:Gfo/Idh/MocA family oxidoreductase [Devosia ginsengisoli]
MVYNVAVIGAGNWSKNHLLGWRAQKDAKITWVVRSNEERAKARAEEWGVANYTADYKKVFADPDVHIVDLVLPHDLHAKLAIEALEAGKHVVLEKPLAENIEDAQRLADAAAASKLKVMVAENWNYGTFVSRAKKLLEAGAIGRPYMIRGALDLDIRYAFKGVAWRHQSERMGGGVLIDAGTHAISVMRHLMGEITEVSAQIDNYDFPDLGSMEDTALVLTRFASGAMGLLSATAVATKVRNSTSFMIMGEKGAIEFDTHDRSFFTTIDKKRSEEFTLEPSRGLVEQMTHFLSAIREDTTPLTSPMEQMGSMRTILAAYESARTGRTVKTEEIRAK